MGSFMHFQSLIGCKTVVSVVTVEGSFIWVLSSTFKSSQDGMINTMSSEVPLLQTCVQEKTYSMNCPTQCNLTITFQHYITYLQCPNVQQAASPTFQQKTTYDNLSNRKHPTHCVQQKSNLKFFSNRKCPTQKVLPLAQQLFFATCNII